MTKSTIKNTPNPTSSGSGEGKHDLIDRQAALEPESCEDAVSRLPAVQPDHTADIGKEVEAEDCISRRAAIDIERNATVDTNPSHFEAHQKFTQFMDDVEVSSFGRWQWSNGFNTAPTAVGIDLKKLPSAQPEIIRCKDCLMHGVCRFERGLGLDGYCSQAKRRTDG